MAVILLLFVYGVTTVGATVHVHFCMNKFVGWDLVTNENTTCNKCGMKESTTKKGCCKDEEIQIKNVTDQQHSTIEANLQNVQIPVLNVFHSFYEFKSEEYYTDSKNILFSPPPRSLVQKRTVLYCTYRI